MVSPYDFPLWFSLMMSPLIITGVKQNRQAAQRYSLPTRGLQLLLLDQKLPR